MVENRVEQIPAILRLWGEGVGLPTEVWEDERVQREVLDYKDGVGTAQALRTAAWTYTTEDVMNNPKIQLECITMVERYLQGGSAMLFNHLDS